MGLLDRLKALFGGAGDAGEPGPADASATPPPAPVDPVGTAPGPIAGMAPPELTTPPQPPREDERE